MRQIHIESRHEEGTDLSWHVLSGCSRLQDESSLRLRAVELFLHRDRNGDSIEHGVTQSVLCFVCVCEVKEKQLLVEVVILPKMS